MITASEVSKKPGAVHEWADDVMVVRFKIPNDADRCSGP